MELNPDIKQILRDFKINVDEGLLCLLGYYHKLDVEKVCSEETIKAINLTKIVEKDYKNNTLTWNMPLFQGQQTEWDWVKNEYNELWNINKDRKESNPDVLKRMQKFFMKYPSIRKEDVMRATRAYFASVKDVQYLMKSTKFIFDGVGALEKSTLLAWVEKTKSNTGGPSGMVGKVIH